LQLKLAVHLTLLGFSAKQPNNF